VASEFQHWSSTSRLAQTLYSSKQCRSLPSTSVHAIMAVKAFFYLGLVSLMAFYTVGQSQDVGSTCRDITECRPGLVCAVGNPLGKCASGAGIVGLTNFILNLAEQDFLTGVTPAQQGPTKNSRALSLILLAAHDAYALLTRRFEPKLDLSANSPIFANARSARREGAFWARHSMRRAREDVVMLAAGLTAAKTLFTTPVNQQHIEALFNEHLLNPKDKVAVAFGVAVGNLWITSRQGDGSAKSDDGRYTSAPYHHQSDPNTGLVVSSTIKLQPTLGSVWGKVGTFVIGNVEDATYLAPPPRDNAEYRDAVAEVTKRGNCSSKAKFGQGLTNREVGVFWAYDGADRIGLPPRLYMQIVLSLSELASLRTSKKIRLLTASAVAMTDAGIAAWYYKYKYDFWRPIVGVRNDRVSPLPGWNPVGIPISNRAKRSDFPQTCVGFTPPFPSYPSGHATFGTAVFDTVARLLRKRKEDIVVTFTSDEHNGETTDFVTQKKRRVITQTFSLAEADKQNQDSRVFLGVHWRFDQSGGSKLGEQVAKRVAFAFKSM
jgi:hypothetical protein